MFIGGLLERRLGRDYLSQRAAAAIGSEGSFRPRGKRRWDQGGKTCIVDDFLRPFTADFIRMIDVSTRASLPSGSAVCGIYGSARKRIAIKAAPTKSRYRPNGTSHDLLYGKKRLAAFIKRNLVVRFHLFFFGLFSGRVFKGRGFGKDTAAFKCGPLRLRTRRNLSAYR